MVNTNFLPYQRVIPIEWDQDLNSLGRITIRSKKTSKILQCDVTKYLPWVSSNSFFFSAASFSISRTNQNAFRNLSQAGHPGHSRALSAVSPGSGRCVILS